MFRSTKVRKGLSATRPKWKNTQLIYAANKYNECS